MRFRPTPLLIACALTAMLSPVLAEDAPPPAGAEQPAEKAEAALVQGKVLATGSLRESDVRLRIRSARHAAIYDVVDGALVPSQTRTQMATLRCELEFVPPAAPPAGFGESRIQYRAELTSLEDDFGRDVLKASRVGAAGLRWAVQQNVLNFDKNRAVFDVALPGLFAPPRKPGRVAGVITLSTAAEVMEFDLPLDRPGVAAEISKTDRIRVVSARTIENGMFEVRLDYQLQAQAPQPTDRMGLVKRFVGLDENGTEINPAGVNFNTGSGPTSFTFAPGFEKRLKKLRLVVVTRRIDLPLQFDVRSTPIT